MTVADTAGKFRGQMQWQQASLVGTRAISIQLTVAVIALQTAIAETTQAVERVEGKVDTILSLAKATMIGDVIGHHQSLKRMVRTLDETGKLPSADWDSTASLGPTLDVEDRASPANGARAPRTGRFDGPPASGRSPRG